MDWFSVILLAGATQGIFLSLALFNLPRGNRAGNRFLAGLLLLFALALAWRAAAHAQHEFAAAQLRAVEIATILCFGPLLWFHAKALTGPSFRGERQQLFHFLPALVYVLVYLVLAWPGELGKFNQPAVIYFTPLSGLNWLALAHVLVYLSAALYDLRQHAHRLQSSFSSLEHLQLNWLHFLLCFCALDWMLVFVWQLFGFQNELAQLPWLFLSFVLYAIGYFALRQPEIFSGEMRAALASMPAASKYQKSTLTTGKAEEYLHKLQEFMARQKPHRDSGLNLPGLAKMLALPPHHLSQIINEKLQQNFFEFVNRHRVAEAQQLLRDPARAHLNIAEIGFTAGFSSISAFNAAFKKITGITPSQFRSNAGPAGTNSHRIETSPRMKN